jgi:hypothetical protein
MVHFGGAERFVGSDYCMPVVPNGCDCFGCCEIQGQIVHLNSSPDCINPCDGVCDVCLGQEAQRLE